MQTPYPPEDNLLDVDPIHGSIGIVDVQSPVVKVCRTLLMQEIDKLTDMVVLSALLGIAVNMGWQPKRRAPVSLEEHGAGRNVVAVPSLIWFKRHAAQVAKPKFLGALKVVRCGQLRHTISAVDFIRLHGTEGHNPKSQPCDPL